MEKVDRSLGELAEAFLLSKQVSGCTEATLASYRLWLRRFREDAGSSSRADALSIHRFFAGLQTHGLGPQSLHDVPTNWRVAEIGGAGHDQSGVPREDGSFGGLNHNGDLPRGYDVTMPPACVEVCASGLRPSPPDVAYGTPRCRKPRFSSNSLPVLTMWHLYQNATTLKHVRIKNTGGGG